MTEMQDRQDYKMPLTIWTSRDRITALNVDEHTERFIPRNWKDWFPRNEALQALLGRCTASTSDRGTLSRADIAALGDGARNGDAAAQMELFFATMMWGYGTRGGRGMRSADSAISSQKLVPALETASECVRQHDIEGGFLVFNNADVPGYGVGFFTKYLYFVGYNDSWSLEKPLIFDSYVIAALRLLRIELGGGLKGKWPRKKSTQYVQYCQALAAWSARLGCRPDQIEMHLYSNGASLDIVLLVDELLKAANEAIRIGGSNDRLERLVRSIPGDLVRDFGGGSLIDLNHTTGNVEP